MSKNNLNKKYFYAIITFLVAVIGAASFVGYNYYKESNIDSLEKLMQAAAKEYVENNNIAIAEGNSLDVSASFLVNQKLLTNFNLKKR